MNTLELSRIAHDLKSPLENIQLAYQNIGFILKLDIDDFLANLPEVLKSMNNIDSNFKFIYQMIQEITYLAEFTRANYTPQIESNAFDLSLFINKVTEPFEYKFKAKRLELKIFIDPNIPLIIYSD